MNDDYLDALYFFEFGCKDSPYFVLKPEFQQNEELIVLAIEAKLSLRDYFSDKIFEKEFVLKIIKLLSIASIETYFLQLPDNLQQDVEIFLATLRLLPYFSTALNKVLISNSSNRNFMFSCCQIDQNLFRHAAAEFKKDEELILDLIERKASVIHHCDDSIKNNRKVIMEACKLDGSILRYASDKLKDDFEIVMTAVKTTGTSIQYASNRLKNNMNLVKEALLSNPISLIYSNETMSKSKELLYFAININPKLFEYFHKDIRNDKSIAMEVLKLDGKCLTFVSQNLKNDKEVVLFAIKNNKGGGYLNVSEALNSDMEVNWIQRKRYIFISHVGLEDITFRWKKWSD